MFASGSYPRDGRGHKTKNGTATDEDADEDLLIFFIASRFSSNVGPVDFHLNRPINHGDIVSGFLPLSANLDYSLQMQNEFTVRTGSYVPFPLGKGSTETNCSSELYFLISNSFLSA